MLLPIGEPLTIAVTLVRAVPTGLVREGTLVKFDGGRYRVKLSGEASSFKLGQTVVMDFGIKGPSRCRSRVDSLEGDEVILSALEALQRPDRRIYPRVSAEISMEYRVVNKGGKGEGLVGGAHLSVAGEVAFDTTDPDVDISCTGVRFFDVAPIEIGTLILVRLQLPPETRWRGVVGEVVRVEEEDVDEFGIAVNFIDLADDTFDRLVEFIGRRQEEMLGIA